MLSDLGEKLEELPTEFRIFTPGVMSTTKGPDLYDEVGARSVLEEYQKQGVDLMIDLNHDSLDPATRRQRADAGDAMGWFNIEQRANGELWAVNVRWTPEGEARLRAKKQRYISPAFLKEKKTRRIVELVNVALVGMPATHNAEALVAASRLELRAGTSFNEISKALEAALYDLFPRDESNPSSNVYVCDTYAESFVFDRDGAYWQAPYKYAGGVAQITGQPVRVVRQYVPAQQAARIRADEYIERARLART
jgi:hypothetical protein